MGRSVEMDRDRLATAGRNWPIVALAFVLALGASAFLLFAPVLASVGETVGFDGSVDRERSTSTLVEGEGPGVWLVVAAPVAVAALALLAQRTGFARGMAGLAAALLVAFAVVAGASVGLFYWPAAIAMVVAAARGQA